LTAVLAGAASVGVAGTARVVKLHTVDQGLSELVAAALAIQ
jgi:hypothetical protein